MENPIKMDDLEVPLFQETSKCMMWASSDHFHSGMMVGIGASIAKLPFGWFVILIDPDLESN